MDFLAAARAEDEVRQIEICGIPVEFPFEPYECQRVYMSKVISALQNGQNALLESPTGTGKTLCLLCATLAWRESVKTAAAGASAGPGGNAIVGYNTAGAGPARGPRSSASGGTDASGHPSSNAPGGAGASGPGSGPPDLPVIIYASRTHSQLQQVIKELRGTSYRHRVRSSILASRTQMCQNPKVMKLPAGAANNACRSLTTKKGCHWYNQLKYSKQQPGVDNIPDIEEFNRVGRAHDMCPFYMSRDGTKDADIIFMPYNYLLDISSRSALEGVRWHNAIVIFDEAHNVEGVCSDVASCDFGPSLLEACQNELDRARAR